MDNRKRVITLAAMSAAAYVIIQARPYAVAAKTKIEGRANECSWTQTLDLPSSLATFTEAKIANEKAIRVIGRDDSLGLLQIATTGRTFWIAARGETLDGPHLLAYLMAEQRWMASGSGGHHVKKGDIVVDVGAHVGTFTDLALAQGAAKVIQIEPDPVNVVALRRNFAKEMADGRVVLIAEGAWSSTSTLDLHIGDDNSGMGSMVIKEQGKKVVRVPVRPLDEQLKEIGITKVDFIKMDIEGAEREALKGAAATIHASKPTLMLESYHLPDDVVVLPQVIKGIRADYQVTTGPCETLPERIIPHVNFFY